MLFNFPLLIIFKFPRLIDKSSILNDIPAFPIAMMILPQFGSSPAIAVLTKGELAIEKAIFFASSSFLQFWTKIDTNFEAPSPSLTTLFARFNKTLFKAESNSLNFSSLIFLILTCFLLLVEKMETISFVLVSPSMVIALKVVAIFFFSTFFNTSLEISASVKI